MQFRTRAAVSAALILLVTSAFYVRVSNFGKEKYTIDEIVYYQLARGILKSPPQYNTIEYADFLIRVKPEAAPLPKYFTAPIFKHPPLFAALVAVSISIFGDDPLSAAYVSALFGALMILLGYFLGRIFFDETIGFLAAAVLFFDPVNIICSQKVWMDTTLAFFMILSLLLFAVADKYGRGRYFVYSGIAAGLAVLTKYPGILATGVIVIYSLLFKGEYFRKKEFIWGLITPVLMLLPWGLWNAGVYGWSGVLGHGGIHGVEFMENKTHAVLLLCAGAVVLLAVWRLFSKEQASARESEEEGEGEGPDRLAVARKILIGLMGLVLLFSLLPHIQRSLSFKSFPVVTWQQGFFRRPTFYFGQLIEFSFLYFFGFLSFFFYSKKRIEDASLLSVGVAVIFLFFLLWGSYQSRYILAATPLLIVLALGFLSETLAALRSRGGAARVLGVGCFVAFFVYVFLKVNYVNFLVSYPNNMCYF